MKRTLGLFVVFALGSAGCGTSHHTAARNVLIALTVASAAVAVGAAVKSRSIRDDLRREVDAGTLSGREFADRDATGTRWNRVARASGFGAGVFLLGVGALWEASLGDKIEKGPREWTPADDPRPIFPVGETR
jgi:hypothetical protein